MEICEYLMHTQPEILAELSRRAGEHYRVEHRPVKYREREDYKRIMQEPPRPGRG